MKEELEEKRRGSESHYSKISIIIIVVIISLFGKSAVFLPVAYP
jgi:hypothetical protein